MRKLLLVVWLLVPVGAGAYHMGPGQDQLRLDEAAQLIEQARGHAERAAELSAAKGDLAAREDWALAETAYEEALAKLPADRVEDQQRVRLARAKCQMFVSELPQANADLQRLIDELQEDGEADEEVLREARRAYANSQYYMTWLMRLEGANRVDWEPRIESARQTFKLLAEESAAAGDEDEGRTAREDLESAIRLARMDLTELQGLPLPSQ
jgi:hypothetical protein